MFNKFLNLFFILLINSFVFCMEIDPKEHERKMQDFGHYSTDQIDLRISLDLFLMASQMGKLDMVKELSKFVHINSVNDQGQTALMISSDNRHENIVRYLIALGADVYIKDYSGKTAFSYAHKQNCKMIEKMLRRAASTMSYELVANNIKAMVDNQTFQDYFDEQILNNLIDDNSSNIELSKECLEYYKHYESLDEDFSLSGYVHKVSSPEYSAMDEI